MDLLSRFFKSKTKKPGSLSSGGTYDVTTKTYTDPMGNKMSTDIKSAQKAGAVMTFGGGGGRSYVGGGTYDVTTHTYTDLFGNKMSMDIESAQKAGATFISSLESQLRSKAEAEAEAKAKAEAEAKRLEQQRIEQQTQAEQQRIERLQMAYAKQRFGEVSPIRREGTLVGFLTPEGRVNLSQTSKQFMAGQVTTKELPPKKAGQIKASGKFVFHKEFITTRKLPSSIKGVPLMQDVVVDESGKFIRLATESESKSLREQETMLKPIEAKDFGIKFQEIKAKLYTDVSRAEGLKAFKLGAYQTGLGFVSAGIDLGGAVIHPIKTGKGLITAVTHPKMTFESLRTSMQSSFRREPSFAIGRMFGEIALLKSPSLVTKGIDIIRTRKLISLPSKSVIAPEFYSGQRFPSITKGTTAGELLREFQPVKRVGVTKFVGFHASSKPFKKITIAEGGTSELKGLYLAPKVSPHFLRISGERKLLSLRMFDTLRPSVIKISPTEFKLAEGVSFSQKTMASLPKMKSFFIKRAELGKAYIPFVKREKEAVIPLGTKLVQSERRFYFEFEGRKVPIMEFETLPKKMSKTLEVKKFSTKDISKISSYGKFKQRGLITPSEMILVAKSSKRSVKPISSVNRKLVSSAYKPVSISSYPAYKPLSVGSYFKSRTKGGLLTSYPKSSGRSRGISSYVSYPREISTNTLTGTGRIISPFPKKLKSKKKPKKSFTVYERRYGKFRPIGTGLSLRQALSIGKMQVSKSLGATFKVKQTKGKALSQPFKFSGFRTKQTPSGTLFIEKRKYRLSKPTEVKEIQRARKRKVKKISRKRKRKKTSSLF